MSFVIFDTEYTTWKGCNENGWHRNQKKEIVQIAAMFKELYARHNINIKSQSSGQIVKLLDIQNKLSPLGLDEHNAFFDVYSVLEGLKFFKTDAIMLLKNDI